MPSSMSFWFLSVLFFLVDRIGTLEPPLNNRFSKIQQQHDDDEIHQRMTSGGQEHDYSLYITAIYFINII